MRVQTNITMGLIFDGDPRALAALCQWRAGAVYAYCGQVAGEGRAMEAAANAFADFRLAVPASGNLTGRDAEALLQRKTRRAAARRGVNVVAADRSRGLKACHGPEIALVRYVERTLKPAVHAVFAEHVAQCRSCAAALHRLQAGERAFQRPPRAPLPPAAADAILRALAGAAPVLACGGDSVAVHEEALRLVTGSRGTPAPAPSAATRPAEQTDRADDPPSAAPQPDGRDPASAGDRADAAIEVRRATASQPADADGRGDRRRPQAIERLKRSFDLRNVRPLPFGGMASAGVVCAGVAGAAFALGLVTLTGDNTMRSRPATAIANRAATETKRVAITSKSTARAGVTQPAPAAGGAARKLRVAVLSTIVRSHEADLPQRGAQVSVHVRITNRSDRVAPSPRPVLHVGGVRVPVAAVSSVKEASPLAPLDSGAVAEGRLRFDTAQPVARKLIAGRLRLRIAGNSVPLRPVIGTSEQST